MPHVGVAPVQVGSPLSSPGQAEQLRPQCEGSLFETHALPHWWLPVLHEATQAVPLQVTVPPAGAWQTVQLFPHEFTSVLPFTTQVLLPQAW
jgi:hypothetical protein